ncbi:MAG: hypothetical protein Q8K30_05305 [Candidatus Gracilibacteria bacterium]|nr:hypothetical protein [Candidatus Gracilibacteria bacterium]
MTLRENNSTEQSTGNSQVQSFGDIEGKGIKNEVSDILETSNNPKIKGLIDLSKSLGLTETSEMQELRTDIIDLINKGESYKHKNIEYEEIALSIIDKYSGAKFAQAQIALNLLKASIYLESGMMEYYNEDIADILDYCIGMGYDDISEELEKIN